MPLGRSCARCPLSWASVAAVAGGPLSADPAYQGIDEFVVGGVVTLIGVGQEVVPQRFGGSVCADQRGTGHGGIHRVPIGSESWSIAVLPGLWWKTTTPLGFGVTGGAVAAQ